MGETAVPIGGQSRAVCQRDKIAMVMVRMCKSEPGARAKTGYSEITTQSSTGSDNLNTTVVIQGDHSRRVRNRGHRTPSRSSL